MLLPTINNKFTKLCCSLLLITNKIFLLLFNAISITILTPSSQLLFSCYLYQKDERANLRNLLNIYALTLAPPIQSVSHYSLAFLYFSLAFSCRVNDLVSKGLRLQIVQKCIYFHFIAWIGKACFKTWLCSNCGLCCTGAVLSSCACPRCFHISYNVL